MKTILAWHWSNGLKCQFDDRPIVPGETLVYEGREPIELCEIGLHASAKILDALYYAPGTTISRVRLSGEIIRGSDKIVATHRTCLWAFDAKYTLISWAADCAERTLFRERKYGREPYPACFEAIGAARKFVKDPSKENRDAAGAAGHAVLDARLADGVHRSVMDAAGYATYTAYYVATSYTPGYAALAVNNAAEAVRYAVSGDAKDGRAAYEKERKWQSARLRNLIAAGRAKV